MCLIILGLSRNASRDAFRLFNEDPYPTLPNFYSPTVIGLAASLVEVIGFAASLVEEIKEILLPARCEALSAISALSAGHYYLMRIVLLLSR